MLCGVGFPALLMRLLTPSKNGPYLHELASRARPQQLNPWALALNDNFHRCKSGPNDLKSLRTSVARRNQVIQVIQVTRDTRWHQGNALAMKIPAPTTGEFLLPSWPMVGRSLRAKGFKEWQTKDKATPDNASEPRSPDFRLFLSTHFVKWLGIIQKHTVSQQWPTLDSIPETCSSW